MTDCPTPGKIPFVSRPEALDHSKRSQQKGKGVGRLRAYQCACGAWHLSSMTKRQAKAARRRAA